MTDTQRLPGLREAYDHTGAAWAAGPEPVYEALATALIARAPIEVRGATVLDIGAGTGVAARASLRAGARLVLATDPAPGMLHAAGHDMHRAAAEAYRLPCRDGSFDLAVAAAVLGHLPDPVRGLREARRVAPALAASAFSAQFTHPAKTVVEDVLAQWGYRPPQWYVEFKRDVESQVGDPDRLAGYATAAGYRQVKVQTTHVDTGVNTPAGQVAWRLGMAHTAPFVATVPEAERARAIAAAERALEGAPALVVPLLVLAATD
jgi:SAM-dependent methyltransferase